MSEESTATANVHGAKAHLSRLLARVEEGGRSSSPASPAASAGPGVWKGKIEIDDSFFDPLLEDELVAWEGR